jgi:hypothetical protein
MKGWIDLGISPMGVFEALILIGYLLYCFFLVVSDLLAFVCCKMMMLMKMMMEKRIRQYQGQINNRFDNLLLYLFARIFPLHFSFLAKSIYFVYLI